MLNIYLRAVGADLIMLPDRAQVKGGGFMRSLIPLALASVVLIACEDSFSPEGVSGTYALVSVNGTALPFSETETQDGITVTVEISAGSLTLVANSTYTFSATFSVEGGGISFASTETDSGTFTLVEPATIRFTGSDGVTSSGTLDGNRITVIEDGDSFVFEK